MPTKKVLQISLILSWFNLIVSSFLALLFLLSGILLMGLSGILIPVVLLGSVILHSYAALQLRKALVTGVAMARQTSTGIRFIGYFALLFSLLYGGAGFALLQNTQEFLKQVQFPAEMRQLNLLGMMRGMGVFILLFSVSILFNVLLNFRLLAWYRSGSGDQG